jgi:hypothetical protein
MTKKDYELIARLLRGRYRRSTDDADARVLVLIVDFADALAEGNPRFDRERFIAACTGAAPEPADNAKRAEHGRAAMHAGDVDGNAASGDAHTGYVDALANMMHAARADGVDFDSALDSARMHYGDEKDECPDCGGAGFLFNEETESTDIVCERCGGEGEVV